MNIMRNAATWLLCLCLGLSPLMTAQAAMIDNGMLLERADPRQTRDSLQMLLGQQLAQQQLRALGINPEQAMERARNLSDSELARINQGITKLNAGGDSVLGVLLIIFIVFVITDAIGATDVFSFVHPIR